LREEHRLKVFENRVLGGYLDLKGRKTDCGENCIMMNFTACILHRIVRMIKSRRTRWAGHVARMGR
jgi:hypothetical protein